MTTPPPPPTYDEAVKTVANPAKATEADLSQEHDQQPRCYYTDQSSVAAAASAYITTIYYPSSSSEAFQQQPQQLIISHVTPSPDVVLSGSEQRQPAQSYTLHIVFSCFVFWCCGWLFGLTAFVLARKSNAHADTNIRSLVTRAGGRAAWLLGACHVGRLVRRPGGPLRQMLK